MSIDIIKGINQQTLLLNAPPQYEKEENTATTQYTLIKSKSISMGNNIYYVLLLICFVLVKRKWNLYMPLEFPFEIFIDRFSYENSNK